MSPILVLRYFEGLARNPSRGIRLLATTSTHHAMHALGSRALGFSQELFAPDDDAEEMDEAADAMLEEMAEHLSLHGRDR